MNATKHLRFWLIGGALFVAALWLLREALEPDSEFDICLPPDKELRAEARAASSEEALRRVQRRAGWR